MKTVLGVDTSCYTTSLALVAEEQRLIAQQRKILSVPQGGRGLRQEEAVFQHVLNLPLLLAKLAPGKLGEISAVAATVYPRSVAGSYLPVFRVGTGWARSIATVLGVPFWGFSHQENHLRVGLWSAGGPQGLPFWAVHLSGGTTEILLIEKAGDLVTVTTVGKGSDLHAGQFVDRVGVALGLSFPAGKQLEELACRGQPGSVVLSASVQKGLMSFSGPLTAALQAIDQGHEPADVALAVFFCIAKSLEKALRPLIVGNGITEVLFVGGVAANRIIANRLEERLGHRAVGAQLFFCKPQYSTDNGVGTALLGYDALTGKGFFPPEQE